MWDNDKVFLWQLLSIRVRQSAGLSPKWPRLRIWCCCGDERDVNISEETSDQKTSKEKNQRTNSTNTHHEHSLAKHLLMALDVAIVY
jgi:hypothetical protein